jgi:hypothetical protein
VLLQVRRTARNSLGFSRERAWKGILIALALAGLAIRIAIIALLQEPALSGPDGPSYDIAARALLSDRSPWDVWQLRVFPVGYASALAGVYAVAGLGSIWVVLLIQCAAFVGATVYLAVVAHRSFGRTASLILAAGLMLAPSGIESSTSLMYEGVLMPASCVILASLIRRASSIRSQWPLVLLALGAFLGVVVHPRYVVVVLGVILASLAWGRLALKPVVVLAGAAVAALCIIAGWNFATLGTPSVSSNQGSNLVIGLDDAGRQYCARAVYEPTDWPLTTPAGDADLMSCALSQIASSPGSWMARAPEKLVNHFEPAALRALSSLPVSGALGGPPVISLIAWGSVIAVTVLALVGGVMLYRDPRWKPLVFVCVAAVSGPLLLSLVFFGLGRFAYASLPFLYLMTSVGLARLMRR